ncbi:MAG: anti-sigma factor [Actinomycetota bacterium]|nr:anti-sigma factor [Actinomycetota bacterium]
MSASNGGRHIRPGDERHDASHGEWDELAVGYALSALEPSELGRFVEHLVNFCPQCQESVEDTNAVGAELATALPLAEPAPQLRTQVLEAAFAARPAIPQTSADLDDVALPAAPVGASETRSEPAAEAVRPISDLAARRQSRRKSAPAPRLRSSRLGWTLAAAAAVLAVVLGVTTFLAVGSRNDQNTLADRRQQAIDTLMGAPGQVVPLRTDGGQTVGTVVARRDTVSVVSDHIPVNARSNTYVLWGIAGTGKSPVALGVFDVRQTGLQTARVAADSRGGYTKFATFAVSREPGHTPPAKPSVIVALGNA